MHRKNIYKIGLSLLIAMAFILPTASVLAVTDMKEKAAINTGVDDVISINNLGAQAAGDVYILNMEEPVLGGPNGNAIVGGCYPITINIQNDVGMGPATVKAFVDIYKKTEGIDVVMYETSFEDNFDIYNNWVQIDADCGLIGGQFDSWSWSDARAYCDDHSMKSTMYDVYKGNQDDYLQCTKSFDVSDQDALKIEFMTWVQGDWNLDEAYGQYLNPFDYLDFEIGDQTGTWINPEDPLQYPMLDWNDPAWLLPGSYYFPDTTLDLYNYRWAIDYTNYVEDMGDGWWKVTFEAPVSVLAGYYGLDITDIMFRFSWKTDPEFQYEGAYVDCIKVISVEHMEEKVFQSHSQGEFIVPEGCTEYTFPMEWCVEAGDKENAYDIKLWLEAVDGIHTSLTDWAEALDIYVIVTEWYDIEVTCLQVESSLQPGWILDTCDDPNVIPDTDVVMEYGDDAHILATIHADGTLPASNIAVTATAYPKTWETIQFTDFESALQPFNNMYGEAHITEKDAWSGSQSLAFFNEEYFEYMPATTFSYALSAFTLDFSGDEDIFMEFYWKGLTEGTTSGTSDYVNPCLYDDHHNTLLGNNGALAGNRLGGYQPDWIGPQQPSCRYQRVNLRQYYDIYTGFGYLHDELGNVMTEVGCGLYFTGDGDSINYNSVARSQGIRWSGVFVDDVRIYHEALGDEAAWSQTVVIPGPLEPCETAEVQFEWENLPYCNYEIIITTDCPGACGNLEDNEEKAQIHVFRDLERASDKEMETVDYSELNNGEFGISSSDYDNYIASNADYHRYVENQNSILQLCIDGEKCIDVTGLTSLIMNFDAWYEIEWAWDFFYIEVAECGADTYLDWTPLTMNYAWGTYGDDFISGDSILDGSNADGWFLQSESNGMYVDLLEFGPYASNAIEVRLHFTSDAGTNFRGIKLDNFNIPALDFDDPCDNLDNWCPPEVWSYGSFWTYDAILDQWCWNQPIASGYNDALIWTVDVTDAYMAELCFNYQNALLVGQVVAEISADGGVTWLQICKFTPTYRFGTGTYCYDMTPFVGKTVLIRFVAKPDGYTYPVGTTVAGLFCVSDLLISGKTDDFAPKTTITMSGTMKGSGWYTTPVKVVIKATDIGGAGMGEIHYKLDGVEKVVAGDKAEFTVSGNGAHTIEYWGIDAAGNVETPHNVAPSFKIDSGAKPTVSITAPTPGIYFNGKKLLSSSNIIIIGSFTVEATASDADSGIYRVSFYLDGNVVADDTTAPFSALICSKHMGAATIKVVAEDFAQNTAEAELSLKYFKFF